MGSPGAAGQFTTYTFCGDLRALMIDLPQQERQVKKKIYAVNAVRIQPVQA